MYDSDHRQALRDIGRRIAELRTALGQTQEQFAAELEIAPKYLGRIERGVQNVSIRILVRFADHLGVQLIDLFAPPQSTTVRIGRPPKGGQSA